MALSHAHVATADSGDGAILFEHDAMQGQGCEGARHG